MLISNTRPCSSADLAIIPKGCAISERHPLAVSLRLVLPGLATGLLLSCGSRARGWSVECITTELNTPVAWSHCSFTLLSLLHRPVHEPMRHSESRGLQPVVQSALLVASFACRTRRLADSSCLWYLCPDYYNGAMSGKGEEMANRSSQTTVTMQSLITGYPFYELLSYSPS